jgi:RimJ/RimL family protein N-acetyltransferase
VVRHAREALRIPRLLAIVTPSNRRSGRVLEKLGFRLEDAPHVTAGGERLNLYST